MSDMDDLQDPLRKVNKDLTDLKENVDSGRRRYSYDMERRIKEIENFAIWESENGREDNGDN